MLKAISDIELDKSLWDRFITDHPNGNIFQSSHIFGLYESHIHHKPSVIAAVNEDRHICGILLFVILKESGGIPGYFTSRSIITGGPIIKDNDPDILDFLLKEYLKCIRHKAIYSQFRNIRKWSESEKQVFTDNGFNYNKHLDILVDLQQTQDKLFNGMHPGRRRNIRKAEQVPLVFQQVTAENEIRKCHLLIQQTYSRIKLPGPDLSFLENASKLLVDKGILKIFAARFKDQIISCRYELCFKNIIYDWYSGSEKNHFDKYPNDFLPWKIFQWGHFSHYSAFDFGGAGKPGIPYGVRDFKMQFGGKLVEYGRFEKVHNRFLMTLGKTGIKIRKFI